jgi:hypothetical protein
VTVGADLALAVQRQEVQPVPQRQQRCAGRERRLGWSSVALKRQRGVAPIRSCRVSLRPTHDFKLSIVVSCVEESLTA